MQNASVKKQIFINLFYSLIFVYFFSCGEYVSPCAKWPVLKFLIIIFTFFKILLYQIIRSCPVRENAIGW